MKPPALEQSTRLPHAGIIEECVEFDWRGLRLRGILAHPESDTDARGGGRTLPCPAQPPDRASRLLVTVHGWASARGGPSGLLATLARAAAAEGAASLRFDLPGRGESAGEYDKTDLDDMIDAAAAACRYLAGRTGLAGCFLCGICSGANAALATAALWPEMVQGVLALSALPYQEHRGRGQRIRRSWGNLKKYFRKALRLGTWRRLFKGEVDLGGVKKAVVTPEAADRSGLNLKRSRRDIPAALACYSGRVTLVWGTQDPEAAGAEKYFRQILRKQPVAPEIISIPGANHNFYACHWHREIAAALGRLLASTPASGTMASMEATEP